MMISRLKDFFTYERETPASLFVVRNIIEGANEFELPPTRLAERTPKPGVVVDENGVEEDAQRILSIITSAENPLTSSEILRACLAHNVCSRATFFRKLKELVAIGAVKKVKRGKNCFYTASSPLP